MKPADQDSRMVLKTFRELCLKLRDSKDSHTEAENGALEPHETTHLLDALLRTAERLGLINERLEMVIESAKLAWWDEDHTSSTVLRSRSWAEMLGYTPEEISSGLFEWKNLIHPDDLPLVEKNIRMYESGKLPYWNVEHRMKSKTGDWVWIQNWGNIVDRTAEGKALRSVGFHLDITRRKQAELEREELIQKLERTLNELKALRGIIPICASCKKIRDDKGAWHQLESYIKKHSEAEFSHGLCPDCAKKTLDEFFEAQSRPEGTVE